MSFGPEYRIADTTVRFGTVYPEVLATHRPANERETQYLSASFIDALSTTAKLHDYLQGPDTTSWAMFVKNRLAGLAIIHSQNGTDFNRTLIFEEHQGQGLAKFAHMVRMHYWLTECGNTHLTSFVDTPNVRSRAAIEGRGYYYIEDRVDDRGESYGVFRAVNPELWDEFHRDNPAQHASSEMQGRVSRSLAIGVEQIVRLGEGT